MSKLTDQEIRELSESWLRQALEDAEFFRAVNNRPLGDEALNGRIENNDICLDEAREHLTHQDNSYVHNLADSLLKKHGQHIDHDSDAYQLLCRELLKKNVELLEIEDRRIRGDYTDEYSASASPAAPVLASPEPLMKLSDALQAYVEEKTKPPKPWGPRSKKDIVPKIKLFIDLVGDVPVNCLSHEAVRQYKRELTSIPRNMKKLKKFRKKSLRDILGMKIARDELLSDTTIGLHYEKVRSFLIWCKRQQYDIKDGLKDILATTKTKKPHQHKGTFTPHDLELIFHAPEYSDDTWKKPHLFWLPILGLYTGARLEELCQLATDDLVTVDNLLCISINSNDEKRVKSIAGERELPLHPFITEQLNIAGYVDSVRSKGKSRLFPELVKISDRYSHKYSGIFKKFRERIGLEADKNGKKTFHSFRHTVVNHLIEKGVSEPVITQLIGQESTTRTEAFKHYAKPRPAQHLYNEAILKIDYGIDLEHLARSRWAGNNL